MQLFPRYRNHFILGGMDRWTWDAALRSTLDFPRRILSREPQHDWFYLFTPSTSSLRRARERGVVPFEPYTRLLDARPKFTSDGMRPGTYRLLSQQRPFCDKRCDNLARYIPPVVATSICQEMQTANDPRRVRDVIPAGPAEVVRLPADGTGWSLLSGCARHPVEVIEAGGNRVGSEAGDLLAQNRGPLRLDIVNGSRVVPGDNPLDLAERRLVGRRVGGVPGLFEQLVHPLVAVD